MNFLRISLLLCLPPLSASAGFKVPDWVYPLDKIEQAKATAEKENKALALVFTEAGST